MLRNRHARLGNGGSGEYAFLTQVRDAAGFYGSRTLDVVTLSLWPSRGMELHGYEVKVSRADLRSDLRNEAKRAVQRDFLHGPDYDVGDMLITLGVRATNYLSFDFTGSYSVYGRNIANGAVYMLGVNLLF